MSEQATNSHDSAVARLEAMLGGEEKPAEELEAAPAEEPQAEANETSEGQEPAQEAQAQPEEKEVEIDGEKYLIPAKIADRFIHHADYTRKTQDVAEMRRALSAEKEAVTLERAFSEAVSQERSRISLLDSQIEQYKKLDWGSLETEQLLKARAQFDQLKDMRAELAEQVTAKRKDFDEKIKNASQEAIKAGEKYVEQKVKNFGETHKKELFAYGLTEGYTRDELDRIIDPRLVVTLWKASQWDKLQASAPQVKNKAAQAAPVVRPGATTKHPSRVQVLSKAVKDAKTSTGKKRAAEDYFAAKFGG